MKPVVQRIQDIVYGFLMSYDESLDVRVEWVYSDSEKLKPVRVDFVLTKDGQNAKSPYGYGKPVVFSTNVHELRHLEQHPQNIRKHALKKANAFLRDWHKTDEGQRVAKRNWKALGECIVENDKTTYAEQMPHAQYRTTKLNTEAKVVEALALGHTVLVGDRRVASVEEWRKLQPVPNFFDGTQCMACKAPITSGNICEQCENDRQG